MSEKTWNIYTRGDGQKVLQFKDERSKKGWSEHRIPREHRTDRQAERYALAWLHEYRRARGARPIVDDVEEEHGPTLADRAKDWSKLLAARVRNKKIKPATMRGHESNLESHILETFGAMRPSELESSRLRKWVRDELPKRTRSTSGKKKKADARKREEENAASEPGTVDATPIASYTIRNIVFTMTAFVDDVVAERWGLDHNPMREKCVRDELPRGEKKAGQGVVIHVTRDQASRLLSCKDVPEFWRVVYVLAMTSGMREDEIGALTWADVKRDGVEVPHVDVTKSVDRHEGKVIIGEPKTRHSRRTVPLHSLALRVLNAWHATGWVHFVGRKPQSSDPVFPDADGAHRVLSNAAAQFRKDLRRAGCPHTYAGHNLVFHSLRASFLTWMADAGVEKALRDRFVGHAPADVGEKHYTARTLAAMRDAVEMAIKLDTKAGAVVTIPMRAVGSDEQPETVILAAEFTAGLPRPAVRDAEIPKDSRRRGSDSNRRMTVLQTVA